MHRTSSNLLTEHHQNAHCIILNRRRQMNTICCTNKETFNFFGTFIFWFQHLIYLEKEEKHVFILYICEALQFAISFLAPYMIDRWKQKKETDFETLHHDYIDHWDHFHENLYENDRPHTNENFRAYLSWYIRATRTKLKVQWTQTDYADIESSDDEQMSYDLATRAGTQVEPAPILDRVVMSTITPSFKYHCNQHA